MDNWIIYNIILRVLFTALISPKRKQCHNRINFSNFQDSTSTKIFKERKENDFKNSISLNPLITRDPEDLLTGVIKVSPRDNLDRVYLSLHTYTDRFIGGTFVIHRLTTCAILTRFS